VAGAGVAGAAPGRRAGSGGPLAGAGSGGPGAVIMMVPCQWAGRVPEVQRRDSDAALAASEADCGDLGNRHPRQWHMGLPQCGPGRPGRLGRSTAARAPGCPAGELGMSRSILRCTDHHDDPKMTTKT
jgi:hypothetical protein